MRKKSWISLTAFLAAILMLNSVAAVMPVYAEEAVVATATTQEEYTGTWKTVTEVLLHGHTIRQQKL